MSDYTRLLDQWNDAVHDTRETKKAALGPFEHRWILIHKASRTAKGYDSRNVARVDLAKLREEYNERPANYRYNLLRGESAARKEVVANTANAVSC